jgi:hypothetical protein
MSGPKTSAYELKLQKKLQLERLQNIVVDARAELQKVLEQLSSYSPEEARKITEQIDAPFDAKSEKGLANYLARINQQFKAIRGIDKQLKHATNVKFENSIGKITNSSIASLENVGSMLDQISELDSKDRTEAKELIEMFDDGTLTEEEVSLVRRLNAVVSGATSFDPQLRELVQICLQSKEQAIAGNIAVESLKELGYEVADGGFSTLFVEGGMVHFQKPGWGDYFVRMRVKPDEGFINFNMVRAGEAEKTLERATRDREMESTWCSEHAELLREMGENGIALSPLRALEPGVVAVQTVPPESLGRSASVGQSRQAPVAKERIIPT